MEQNNKLNLLLLLVGIIICILLGILIGILMKPSQPQSLNNTTTNSENIYEEPKNEEEKFIPYEEGIQSITFTYYNEILNGQMETIEKKLNDKKAINSILNILKDKTENNAQNFGGMFIPSMTLVYQNKKIEITFMDREKNNFIIDGTMYTINYNGNAYNDIKHIIESSNANTTTSNNLNFYEGIQSISYITYSSASNGYPTENAPIIITDMNKIKIFLAIINSKTESDAKGFGGIGLSRFELNYNNKKITITFPSTKDKIVTIDGKTYEFTYSNNDYYTEILNLFQ